MDEVPVFMLTLDGSTRVDKLVSELERVELLPVCKFVKNKRDTEDESGVVSLLTKARCPASSRILFKRKKFDRRAGGRRLL